MLFFSGEDDDVKLAPLASSFDLRVVAAPPVVYVPPDGDAKVLLGLPPAGGDI